MEHDNEVNYKGKRFILKSNTSPHLNGTLLKIKSRLAEGDLYKCRSAGDVCEVYEERFRSEELLEESFSFEGDHFKYEITFKRSVMLVLDDEPCGKSFKELIKSLKNKPKRGN